MSNKEEQPDKDSFPVTGEFKTQADYDRAMTAMLPVQNGYYYGKGDKK